MAVKKDIFSKLFSNNKFVFVFSLVAAFVLWMTITLVENPVRDTTFSDITISVVTDGTAAGELGLDLISITSPTATVRVSGPSYVLASLEATDISVTLPLSDVTEAGKYDINLSAASTKVGGVNIVGITPSKVTAVFDYTDTKQFNVEVEAIGAVAVSGLVADTPTVSNSADATIAITGPRSELSKISRVVAVAEVNEKLSATESFSAKLHLYDEAGNELAADAYSLPVTDLKITVPILKQKVVPLKVAFSNKPDFYAKNDISYNVSATRVSVLGPATTIDDLDSISLAPIDFDSITPNNNKFDVAPMLPNGVKLSENLEVVTVNVNINGFAENTFTVNNFEFKNITNGLTCTATAIKNVKICGPRATVRNLKATDLYAVADLQGKTAGEYTVAVRVYSKSHDNIWQIGTYNVVVTIK